MSGFGERCLRRQLDRRYDELQRAEIELKKVRSRASWLRLLARLFRVEIHTNRYLYRGTTMAIRDLVNLEKWRTSVRQQWKREALTETISIEYRLANSCSSSTTSSAQASPSVNRASNTSTEPFGGGTQEPMGGVQRNGNWVNDTSSSRGNETPRSRSPAQ